MDDIRYLQRHAKEESYLFMCDSKMRDVDAFPTPSEYEVTFSRPFQNVFSVDLIDATIPRTEYVVEQGRNTLTYAVQGHPTRTITLQPGDYNLPQLVEAMNERLAASDDGLRVETQTIPSELSNKVKFTCGLPFVLYMDQHRSGLRDCLGFANPVNQADVTYNGAQQFATPPQWTPLVPATWEFHSVGDGAADGTKVLEGPVPVDAFETVSYGAVALRQYFTPTATGTPSSVVVRGPVPSPNTMPLPNLTVRVHVASDEVATATAVASYEDNMVIWRATFPTNSGAVVPANAGCFVQISCDEGSARVYRAQSNARLSGNQGPADVVVRVALPSGTLSPIPQIDEDLCVDLVVATDRHWIVSPGLVDLTGERYITVRCPEVEQLMFRERAYEKFHAGLGMVKLSGYGYRDQRYDFVSFPPRRFHAKSLVTKLTIRLEKADGSLYNAHGIDHTLLLVIRYYTEPQGMPTSGSTLNPAYTPNLHDYLGSQKLADEEERAFYRTYGLEQRTTTNGGRRGP